MPAVRLAAAVATLALAVPAGAHPAVEASTLSNPHCTSATVRQAPPFGSTACPGVRPGAVLATAAEQCTIGFLFAGSDKRRYAATAGHCAYDPDPSTDTTTVWKPGTGPVATDGSGKQIGRFAYARNGALWRDFALVRLDKGVVSYPQMCHFGGPTGINTTVANDELQVHQYGQMVGLRDVTPARTGDATLGLYRVDMAFYYGVAEIGDSGSPVTDTAGGAIGIVTDRTTGTTGNIGVNRLAAHLADAQQRLRIRLTLLTAPLL